MKPLKTKKKKAPLTLVEESSLLLEEDIPVLPDDDKGLKDAEFNEHFVMQSTNTDKNIAEGIIIDSGLSLSETALFSLMSQGFLGTENVVRLSEYESPKYTNAEKRAIYSMALEENDLILDKIKNLHAAKMLLKESLFKKYGKAAKLKVKAVKAAIEPSLSRLADA